MTGDEPQGTMGRVQTASVSVLSGQGTAPTLLKSSPVEERPSPTLGTRLMKTRLHSFPVRKSQVFRGRQLN